MTNIEKNFEEHKTAIFESNMREDRKMASYLADCRGEIGEDIVCESLGLKNINKIKNNNPDYDAISALNYKTEIKVICSKENACINNFMQKDCNYMLLVILPEIFKGINEFCLLLIKKEEFDQIDDGWSSRNGKNIGKWVLPKSVEILYNKDGSGRKVGVKQEFFLSHIKTEEEVLKTLNG